jgi:hypothetical protein
MCRKNGKADQSKERSNDIHDATFFVGGSLRAGLFQARFVRSGKSFRRKRQILRARQLTQQRTTSCRRRTEGRPDCDGNRRSYGKIPMLHLLARIGANALISANVALRYSR